MVMHKLRLPTAQVSAASLVMVRAIPHEEQPLDSMRHLLHTLSPDEKPVELQTRGVALFRASFAAAVSSSISSQYRSSSSPVLVPSETPKAAPLQSAPSPSPALSSLAANFARQRISQQHEQQQRHQKRQQENSLRLQPDDIVRWYFRDQRSSPLDMDHVRTADQPIDWGGAEGVEGSGGVN